MDQEVVCNACGGSRLIPLGTLGSLAWFRCRECGWDSAFNEEKVCIEFGVGEEVEA